MKNFNNSEIIAKGWYIVCRSREVSQEKVKSLEICGQKIVVFRTKQSQVKALDAYCPHLGTDLGIGKVEGDLVRCFFHHWAFDGEGNCQDIPCQSAIPEKAKLQAYATAEKYGFIWIYPESKAPESLTEFEDLKGKEIIAKAGKAFERSCHHHICMMNGIDAQHLQTVHQLNIEMSLECQQNLAGTQIDFILTGEFPNTNFKEKIARKFLGANYQYSMSYANGCMGLLTMMQNVRLFPPLYMIYAYTPVGGGKTRIQPIYVTAKRKGIFGWLSNRLLIFFTQVFYHMLRGEDGKIYDNISFNPNVLLPIDAPLVKYINYVNNLEPSIWSRSTLKVESP